MVVKIGILGGGQLARMLALKAHELGIEPHILSPSPRDPAAQVTSYWKRGNPNAEKAVLNFKKNVDVLTFESEFTSAKVLKALSPLKNVSPSASLMQILQNRSSQKKLIQKYKIPTSPFVTLSKSDFLSKKFSSFPKVMKSVLDGYDGKGTFILKKNNLSKALEFLKKSPGVIVEDFIPFRRELALSIVRSAKGEIISLPLVETKQVENRCLWVKGPVIHKSLPSLIKKLKHFVRSIDYVGIMAFELFDTGEKLIVNEIAPRVHNSGHYSMNALQEDQFIYQIKAVLGLPLKKPQLLKPGFAMYNLIGSSKKKPSWAQQEIVNLHWYGKDDNRPGRKMGHLNAVGETPTAALNKVKKASKEFHL